MTQDQHQRIEKSLEIRLIEVSPERTGYSRERVDEHDAGKPQTARSRHLTPCATR
ncbi:hypothetical protein ACQEVF_41975 [Nonomuraea polychroma]|uniref:hypothetical protein n=1 Tax=Nonomuraea polychroma TaxID=46176 RepID=UPI003D8DA55E